MDDVGRVVPVCSLHSHEVDEGFAVLALGGRSMCHTEGAKHDELGDHHGLQPASR